MAKKERNTHEDWFINKEDFLYGDLGLNPTQSDIYATILAYNNKCGCYLTADDFAYRFNISRGTAVNTLNYLCDRNLVAKLRVSPHGSTQTRCIYVAYYTKLGRRSNEEIIDLFKKGYSKLTDWYQKVVRDSEEAVEFFKNRTIE